MTLTMTKLSKVLLYLCGAATASALAYFGFTSIGWSVGQSAVTAGILVVASGLCAGLYGELRNFRLSAEGTDKERRKQLQQVMRMAGMFAWEVDLESNKVTYSDDIYELFGYPKSKDVHPEDYITSFVHPDDREKAWGPIMEAPEDVNIMESEYRLIMGDGTTRLFRSEAHKERDIKGRPVKIIGTTQDITERREAERRLRSHSAIIRETDDTVMITAPDGAIHDVNPATTRLTGYARTELVGKKIYDLWDWATLLGVPVEEMKESLRNEGRWQAEHGITHRDGALIPVETTIHTITDDNENTAERVITIRDISARREAEQSLRDSERLLVKAQELAHVGSWEMDWSKGAWVWSEQMREIFDLGPGDDLPTQETFFERVHPDDVGEMQDALARAHAGGEPFDAEFRIRTSKGREKTVHGTAEYDFDDKGQIVKSRGAIQDITERRTSGHALADSERRLVWAQEKAQLGSWERNLATGDSIWSEQLYRMLEIEPDTPLESGALFYRFVHPDDVEDLRHRITALAESGTLFQKEYRIRTAQGHEKILEGHGEVIRDGSGKPVAIGGTIQDITERMAAEQALAQSEQRLAWAQEKAHLGSWDLNLKTGDVFWSEQFYHVLGTNPKEDIASAENFYKFVHPSDMDELRQAVDAMIATGESMDLKYRVRTKQGVIKTVHCYAEVTLEAAGEPIAIGGTIQDISAQQDTERKLAQAMKMETVGQLSAGVAHDFNNLLAVIMGNLELIQMRAEGKAGAHVDILDFAGKALIAGASGADLVKRLLAYSRRQMLFPERTRINDLVGGMVGLFKRSLGRNIEIDFQESDDLWDAEVDAAQLESALTNLAVNARDAMPEGGRLTITTHNISGIQEIPESRKAGARSQYVCIDVTDTGTGMPQELIDKAIEPFFTTKEVGKGTGLGLSMVYGFVRQSEGIFNITSREGVGTTVRLFLPRMLPAHAELSLVETPSPAAKSGTVLIVEDDSDVINIVTLQVQQLGYRTLDALDFDQALAILESDTAVDLLLTDVILGPGPNGANLALKAQEIRPGLAVLCMSGFVEPETFQKHAGTSALPFIAKPFTSAALGARIRAVLKAEAEYAPLPRSS